MLHLLDLWDDYHSISLDVCTHMLHMGWIIQA
jgi:hypothetical protein